MRITSLAGTALIAALLIGCSNGDEATKAAARKQIEQYEPPSVTSRADFGGLIERRFRRLDTNGDGKLSQTELPARLAGRIARYDTNKDGQLDSGEWGKMLLERFDRQDANKDGSVTTDERQAMRAERRARTAGAAAE